MRCRGRVVLAMLTPFLFAMTACSQHIGVGTAVRTPAAAAVLAPGCQSADTLAPTLSGLVGVDPDPTSVVALWWALGQTPGGPPCRSWRVTGDGTAARALASSIRAAPGFPSGRINCPSGLEIGAHLYFGFAHGENEYVQVDFSTCGAVGAPHRDIRVISPAVEQALRPIAPSALARVLS